MKYIKESMKNLEQNLFQVEINLTGRLTVEKMRLLRQVVPP